MTRLRLLFTAAVYGAGGTAVACLFLVALSWRRILQGEAQAVFGLAGRFLSEPVALCIAVPVALFVALFLWVCEPDARGTLPRRRHTAATLITASLALSILTASGLFLLQAAAFGGRYFSSDIMGLDIDRPQDFAAIAAWLLLWLVWFLVLSSFSRNGPVRQWMRLVAFCLSVTAAAEVLLAVQALAVAQTRGYDDDGITIATLLGLWGMLVSSSPRFFYFLTDRARAKSQPSPTPPAPHPQTQTPPSEPPPLP